MDPEAPSSSSILLGSQIDPSTLHPLASILDNQHLDYLLLEDDKLSSTTGPTALPTRGWADELCYGTGSTYLAGTLTLPSATPDLTLFFHRIRSRRWRTLGLPRRAHQNSRSSIPPPHDPRHRPRPDGESDRSSRFFFLPRRPSSSLRQVRRSTTGYRRRQGRYRPHPSPGGLRWQNLIPTALEQRPQRRHATWILHR